jgi:hypothetical protein
MNNATNLAIAAILMAATLVVGATLSTATTQLTTAFAYSQKKKVGGAQDNDSSRNNSNKNGNTVTTEECKNRGSASGFDTAVNQECENLICTHPNDNATCSQEGIITTTTPIPLPTPTPTPEPTTTTLLVKKVLICTIPRNIECNASSFRIHIIANNNPDPDTFRASESGTLVTFSGPGTYTINEGPPPSFIPPFGTITFAGDCTQITNTNNAIGTISAGEHQTCIITNTQGPI